MYDNDNYVGVSCEEEERSSESCTRAETSRLLSFVGVDMTHDVSSDSHVIMGSFY